MEVNERIAGHRTSVFSEENFSQIYPAFQRNFGPMGIRERSADARPNPKETPNPNIQRDVAQPIFWGFVA
jgi:hypothetical protein